MGRDALSVAGTKGPRFRPSRGSAFLELCSWAGSGGREGRTEGWVEGLDVAPSFLSLNWGLGLTLFQERSGMWSSHVPRKRREGGLETCYHLCRGNLSPFSAFQYYLCNFGAYS